MKALLRLKWDACCSWVSNGGGEEVESEGGLILNPVDSVIERYRTATTAEKKKKAYLLLSNTATRVEDLLMRLKQETSSKLFKFWDKYIEMILLLLEFIRAERDGDWELHLKVTTNMIPYFLAMDRLNYSRWLPVYIMDVTNLQEKALPRVP